jgi:NADH-quinone oxidoreductase subunit I
MDFLRYFQDLAEGIATTLGGLRTTGRFAKDNWTGDGRVTVAYPEVQPELAPRFRGHLYNDKAECVVCLACEKICPVDCFTIVGERMENGRMRPAVFDIDLSKCISCGLCVKVCDDESLVFTKLFETAPERHAPVGEQRWLFRTRPDQVKRVLDSSEVERLARIGGTPREQLAPEDVAFLDTIEDPERGTSLIGRYGYGMYTPEEKARVETALAAEKKRKAEAAAAAKAAAAKAAAPAAEPAQPGAGA